MSLHIFQALPATRALLVRLAAKRAQETVEHIRPYLQPGEKLLDVGAGICDITSLLGHLGYAVTPLDTENFSCMPGLQPLLYDGRTMPFENRSFDTALILTVLHHTPDPLRVLQEAQRVAKRLIIIEDVHKNTLHKYGTFFMDSLLNLEFFGHPHSNKTDDQWRKLFQQQGLKLVSVKAMRSFGILRHRLYVLET